MSETSFLWIQPGCRYEKYVKRYRCFLPFCTADGVHPGGYRFTSGGGNYGKPYTTARQDARTQILRELNVYGDMNAAGTAAEAGSEVSFGLPSVDCAVMYPG